MGVELLTKYFPELSAKQVELFKDMEAHYADWNAKINVISRKDFEHFYERHVLHSLAISKVQKFDAGMQVLDIGTGGGFPGIPLAIMFPDVQFTLIDSIAKKLKVVDGVCEALGITNIKTVWNRVETLTGPYDYAVTRAVAPVDTLLYWLNIPSKPKGKQGYIKVKNALICLKGGELEEELENIYWPYTMYDIKDWYAEEFFETKKVIKISFSV